VAAFDEYTRPPPATSVSLANLFGHIRIYTAGFAHDHEGFYVEKRSKSFVIMQNAVDDHERVAE
jgi:hypothetical protein